MTTRLYPSFPGKKAFTLVELLTVIAIIAILAALLFPIIAKMNRSAQSAATISNLTQVGTAANKYAQEHDGQYFGNGADYPKIWMTEFWPYIYPGTPFPFPNFSAADSGAIFKKTVFYTPLIESKPTYGGQPRSFGYNYPIEQRFAPSLRYNALISNPSAVAILGDTKTSGSWTPGQVNPRYNNSVHVSFLDLHAELVPMARIPAASTDTFWSGPAQP